MNVITQETTLSIHEFEWVLGVFPGMNKPKEVRVTDTTVDLIEGNAILRVC